MEQRRQTEVCTPPYLWRAVGYKLTEAAAHSPILVYEQVLYRGKETVTASRCSDTRTHGGTVTRISNSRTPVHDTHD